MSERLAIEFGFLVPKMNKQLERYGYRLPRKHIADEANQALSMLCLAKIITPQQRDAGRVRLMKRIVQDAKPIRKRAALSSGATTTGQP